MTKETEGKQKKVYEIAKYQCPDALKGNCNYFVSGSELDPIRRYIIINGTGNDMQDYHNAHRDASDGAPICPYHNIATDPLIVEVVSQEFTGNSGININ